MLKVLTNILKSRIGWLLVIVNMTIFSFLLKEVQRNEANRPQCENGKVVSIGLIAPSNLFLIHTLVNFPALITQAKASQIIFHDYQDPCTYYNFESYPVVYAGKYAMIIIFESLQWILIGYLIQMIFGMRKAQE